jgi:hypothetical protein
MQAPITSHVSSRLIAVALLTCVQHAWARDSGAPQTPPPQAAPARRILEAYRAESPQPASKKLRLICWRTRERDFPANHRARLQRIMEHIRGFYADEMERNGLGRLTFQLDTDAAGALVVYEAVGSGTFDEYTKQEGGKPIREDCWRVLRAAGLDPDQETVVIFTNLAKWDPAARTFSHHSPYMGTGTCRSGIAWQLDHPALDVLNLPLKEPLIQDGEYGRISLGKHNSIFIGGIAHELGHALGLPHCRESEAEAKALGTALMGSGNRTYGDPLRGEGKGTFLTLGHALRLASHPLFCGSVKGLSQQAEAQFSGLSVAAGRSDFDLSGTVTSAVPVYALVAYFDPEGNSDYDARMAVAQPKADGAFTLRSGELVAGKAAALRLCALLANGAVSRFQSGYRVAKDGSPDVAAMEVSFALEPFLRALDKGSLPQAAALRDALPQGGRARACATSLLAARTSPRPADAPASVPADRTCVPLSQVAPAQARVGWGRPTYDRLPERDALLIAGGELFETGIYAHAPASHRYDLAGGWKRLTGKCGLPSADGSVVFVIRTDGKEALRTGALKPGRTQAFGIDLTGVRELELSTEDAGDGNRADWGLWLGVQLER